MFFYDLYGLSIRSCIKFEFLNPADSSSHHDVNIIELKKKSLSEYKLEDQIELKNAKIFRSNVGLFILENGNIISFIRYSNDVSDATVSRSIINVIFGYCLYQRNNFVIHASSVRYKDDACLFVGPSGIGKSSFSASFNLLKEISFICEDVAFIKKIDESYQVVTGPPLIKLTDEMMETTKLKYNKKYKLKTDRLNRSLYEITNCKSSSTKIKCCYFLEWGDKFSISKLESSKLLPSFLINTYTAFPFNACKESSLLFHNFIEEFVKKVPIYKITRKKNKSFKENKMIIDHLNKI